MMSLLLLSAAMAPPPLRQRTVAVTPNLDITVFELSSPGDLVQQHWTGQSSGKDPFGTVLWPGALFAARKMCARPELIRDRDVLCAFSAWLSIHPWAFFPFFLLRVSLCLLPPLQASVLARASRH